MPTLPSAHELDALTERVDSHEDRIERLSTKVDDLTYTSLTRHSELMGALGNLSKSQELAEQRAQLRLDGLERVLGATQEGARHWSRYLIATVLTALLSGAGWIVGHFFGK